MSQKNINESYIDTVRKLNSRNKTRIKTEYGLTEETNVSAGIRQEDSLSPCLFNIIMDKIIESLPWETNGKSILGNPLLCG